MDIDIILKILYNVIILFLMMIPGIILKKFNLIPKDFSKGISNLVLYIAQPALVFISYVRAYDADILINSLWVLLLSFAAHFIFFGVTMLFFKGAEDTKRRMLRFATIFSNAAFMGIPLINAALGSEATLYASIYNFTFNIFLWSLGVNICTANRDIDGDGECDGETLRQKGGGSVLRAFIHPVTIAAFLGLVVFVTPLDGVISGTIVTDALDMLSALVAPLSMTVIGIRLAEIDLRGFFRDKDFYIFLALRHFALPLVVVGIVRLLALVGLPLSSDVIMVTVILAATPAASSATMFAEKYDCNAAYVSKLVAVSTILSIISMPVLILLATL